MGKYFLLIFLFISTTSNGIETKLKAVVDLRVNSSSTIESYLNENYGKFANSDGQSLTLSQLGIESQLFWTPKISSHIVLNVFQNDDNFVAGLTEGYFKYRSVVNESGNRWQTKVGIFYPEISIENNAIAWTSKYTLNSSMINTWIGEELRALGAETSVTKLGRFNKLPYDLSFSVAAFVNNDPAGSLLSWHGWTQSNRQTLWSESRPLPSFFALRPGNALAGQAKSSDPFLEIDSRVGFFAKAKIRFHQKGEFSFDIYDNNAAPYIVENGQYAWDTRFIHLSGRWLLPYGIQLTGQYLKGDTLMQSPDRVDMVNNDYTSAYITLSKRIGKHRMTSRFEEFSITDNDHTLGDNNNEYGKALTLNYTYRIAKPTFLAVEYNWINSDRMARMYLNLPQHIVERQWQLSLKYFY